jgi:predicted small metal-binding protein
VARSFACRDDGEFPDCPGLVRGETEEEVIRGALEHGREVHGMRDEQLRDPAVRESIRGYIREA